MLLFNTHTRALRVAATLALSSVAFITGCGSPPAEEGPGSPVDAVVIVADTHANAPAPRLDDATRALLDTTLSVNGLVRVVHVSAHPEVAELDRLEPVEGTDAGKRAIVRRNLARIERELGIASAHAGADDFEAIAMAAEILRGSGARRPVLVFSGLGAR